MTGTDRTQDTAGTRATEPGGRFVVGVDGSAEGMLAVRYAVEEARRAGVGVVVAHAVPEVLPTSPLMPLLGVETFVDAGRRIIRDALAIAREEADGEVEVTELLRPGSRIHLLVEAGEHARALVLGRRDQSRLSRIFMGSTTTAVATRAHCPVLAVPPAWSPGRHPGEVVVGVEEPGHTSPALERAFAAAAERSARLTVLHTWKFQTPYDGEVAARVHEARWREAVVEHLERTLKGLREQHPDVAVELDVRHQHPAAALVGASESAELVVLGRHGHGAPFGFYLGSVARTLLHEARCPVEVVPGHG